MCTVHCVSCTILDQESSDYMLGQYVKSKYMVSHMVILLVSRLGGSRQLQNVCPFLIGQIVQMHIEAECISGAISGSFVHSSTWIYPDGILQY